MNWTDKELEILSGDKPLKEKERLLPGRSLRSIKNKGLAVGCSFVKQGSAGRSAWTPKETTILKLDISLGEKVKSLPGRSPKAVEVRLAELRKSDGCVKPPRPPVTLRAGRGRPIAIWSVADIEIISRDIAAKDAAPMLEHVKSVWVINEKRRSLNLPRPSIGRPTLRPENYPGTNWSQRVAVLAKTLGVCWLSAKQLKRLALGK